MAVARIAAGLGVFGIGVASVLAAQEITNVSFLLRGEAQSITQAPDIDADAVEAFYERSARCQGVCIAPMEVAPGVQTVDELEVIAFLTTMVASGEGVVIDSRDPANRQVGGIVSAINLPPELLTEQNPFRRDIFMALGAREFQGIFNFADALPLLVFDSGPSSHQATNLVMQLVNAGYPPERIRYYRGGMQVWAALGLSMEEL